MKRKVLVVAVHPDDETLGCGGTILKHRADKDQVYWLIATQATQAAGFSAAKVAAREKEIALVAKAYGFAKVYRLGIPTAEVDKVPMKELVKKIAGIMNKVRPHTLYLPFNFDVHSDHRSIFEAAYSCTKSFRFPFLRRLLMMETLSETDFSPAVKECSFVPHVFVDISRYIRKKLEIMKVYKGELGQHPFPRNLNNIRALAHLRGATAGCRYAESFMLIKEIV
jgi:LmbE family N-acetylglucosaminyl deacetylase